MLLQEQFDVSPHAIGRVFVASNLCMFLTEFVVAPLVTRVASACVIVLLALLLLAAGKFAQLFVSGLCSHTFAVM